MRIGAQVSVAGGVNKAFDRAEELGADSIQIFALSPRQWKTAAPPDEVLEAFQRLARSEGIIPALESAHALAWVMRVAGTAALPTGSTVLVTLSGRGDKDVAQVRDILRVGKATPR